MGKIDEIKFAPMSINTVSSEIVNELHGKSFTTSFNLCTPILDVKVEIKEEKTPNLKGFLERDPNIHYLITIEKWDSSLEGRK